MSPEEAEQFAIPFGLTYLSRDGYAKLALLLAWLIERERRLYEASGGAQGAAGWREG